MRPGFREYKPGQRGTVTGRDDPHRKRKRKRERATQAAMLEYFAGLQKRVLAAIEAGEDRPPKMEKESE